MMTLSRRIVITGFILYLLSQTLFLINIQFPRTPNFDEFHYVPSAKQFLAWTENQNWEHPPLGKMLMAVGIAVGGDRPFGWRMMSTFFGALTLLGMYAWGLAMFRNERVALWVALVTLFNQLLYVQSRIGMLDTFMFAFLVWGCAFFTEAWRVGLSPERLRKLLLWTGLLFGLAAACKWFAIVAWASCLMLVLGVKLLHSWQMSFAKPRDGDWYSPALWNGLRARDWLVSLVVVPVAVYLAFCVPMIFTQNAYDSFWDLFKMQKVMYEGQLRVTSNHPYMSTWKDWPLMTRPIWYAFDKEGSSGEIVRGVVLLGNPLVMWAGLVGLVACAWGWITLRSREAFLILAFYLIFFGSWVAIPRKISFYYYYYPAGMLLSLALAYLFEQVERGKSHAARWTFLAISFGLFVYFFPILAALKIPSESFSRWMWLWSWV